MKLESLVVDQQPNTPYILFNDIECVFRKSGKNKYLIFCKTKQNEIVLQNYAEIIDEIREQILFTTGDVAFVIDKHFTRLKFKTSDDDLLFNKKINVSV